MNIEVWESLMALVSEAALSGRLSDAGHEAALRWLEDNEPPREIVLGTREVASGTLQVVKSADGEVHLYGPADHGWSSKEPLEWLADALADQRPRRYREGDEVPPDVLVWRSSDLFHNRAPGDGLWLHATRGDLRPGEAWRPQPPPPPGESTP